MTDMLRNSMFRKIGPEDSDMLFEFFESLSDETKRVWQPHGFNYATTIYITDYTDSVVSLMDGKIVAYCAVTEGVLADDKDRLGAMDVVTVAPCVLEGYRRRGIGTAMLEYVHGMFGKDLLLWGGVVQDNYKAIGLYEKLGFKVIGEWTHETGVECQDMTLEKV